MKSQKTDDDLMSAIAQGDHLAFEILFDRHNGKLLGYAYQLLSQRGSAEDIVQETWMKIIRLAPSYSSQGTFIAWVFTIIRNSCFSEIKRSGRSISIDQASDDSNSSAYDTDRLQFQNSLFEKFEVEEIKKEVALLPESQRVALLLWAFEDLSYELIAKELVTSVSSVKSLLFRARQTLLRGRE